jgi:hypothetical protein
VRRRDPESYHILQYGCSIFQVVASVSASASKGILSRNAISMDRRMATTRTELWHASDGPCIRPEENVTTMAVVYLSRRAVVIAVAQARCKNLRLGMQVREGVLLPVAHSLSWIKAITLGACHLYWLPLSLQGVWHGMAWHGKETFTLLTLSRALLVVLASPL